LMGDLTDAAGGWARFLWYFAPEREFFRDGEKRIPSASPVLQSLYEFLLELPATNYSFSRKAMRRFDDWHNFEWSPKKFSETSEGLKGALSKLPGYVVRLAGIHHVLQAAAQNEAPLDQITAESIEAAIKLANFFYDQLLLIYANATNDAMSSKLNKVLELSKTKGTITVRDCMRAFKESKDSILRVFEELENQCFGKVSKVKNSVSFTPEN